MNQAKKRMFLKVAKKQGLVRKGQWQYAREASQREQSDLSAQSAKLRSGHGLPLPERISHQRSKTSRKSSKAMEDYQTRKSDSITQTLLGALERAGDKGLGNSELVRLVTGIENVARLALKIIELENAGLVSSSVRGRGIRYSLTPAYYETKE